MIPIGLSVYYWFISGTILPAMVPTRLPKLNTEQAPTSPSDRVQCHTQDNNLADYISRTARIRDVKIF